MAERKAACDGGPSEIKVYVTGMGVLNAIAESSGDFERSLRAGKQGMRLVSEETVTPALRIRADIPHFSLAECLEISRLTGEAPETAIARAKQLARRSPFPVQTAVATLMEAWIQASLFQMPISPERLGIIVAGHNLTMGICREQTFKYNKAPEYVSPAYALQFMDTDHVGTLSEIFGIEGEGCTVGGASASGNVGIIKARQMLQLGIADACVVVGALSDLTAIELQGFANIGALGGKSIREPDRACRPFDRAHEGFIYGQGSGCIILERADSVARRKVSPLAEMAGGAIRLDGNRLSHPNAKGEAGAMERALADSGTAASEVDYINAHGSSSPLGDETELKAIKEVFKEETGRIWLNSTKGLTGHCLFSAGVVEAIASILQIRGGFVHPNANLEHPLDVGFRFAGRTAAAAPIQVVLSNSFGFGGINTSIVLKASEQMQAL